MHPGVQEPEIAAQITPALPRMLCARLLSIAVGGPSGSGPKLSPPPEGGLARAGGGDASCRLRAAARRGGAAASATCGRAHSAARRTVALCGMPATCTRREQCWKIAFHGRPQEFRVMAQACVQRAQLGVPGMARLSCPARRSGCLHVRGQGPTSNVTVSWKQPASSEWKRTRTAAAPPAGMSQRQAGAQPASGACCAAPAPPAAPAAGAGVAAAPSAFAPCASHAPPRSSKRWMRRWGCLGAGRRTTCRAQKESRPGRSVCHSGHRWPGHCCPADACVRLVCMPWSNLCLLTGRASSIHCDKRAYYSFTGAANKDERVMPGCSMSSRARARARLQGVGLRNQGIVRRRARQSRP